MSNATSQIITPKWLIPVDDKNTVLENHSLVIDGGKIVDILPNDTASETYPQARHTILNDHALIPGLINTHTHAAMSLFRGLADDLPLMTWLTQYIWPAEAKWVNEDFIQDGARLAIAEMLLSGTTCFNDMYFFPNVVARTAQDIGMRSCVGLIVIDTPTIWAQSIEEYLDKAVQVSDELRSLSLVTAALAPHAPYTVDDAALQRVQLYADELHIPVHMHIHETKDEIQGSLQQYGQRPLARLHDLGLLTPRMIAVHMTQLTDDEIALCAKLGVQVAHCPESNLKLNSGYCPAKQLLDAGINVALGTDSAASNNDLDMLGEMHTAALLAKTVANDAEALAAHDVLKMATINAAKALNLDKQIGSLAIGKAADMAAINLNAPATQPVYDPVSQLIYSASRDQITDVWVNGSRLVKDRQLTTLDQKAVLEKARYWAEKIHTKQV